jgi:hypothetical protein
MPSKKACRMSRQERNLSRGRGHEMSDGRGARREAQARGGQEKNLDWKKRKLGRFLVSDASTRRERDFVVARERVRTRGRRGFSRPRRARRGCRASRASPWRRRRCRPWRAARRSMAGARPGTGAGSSRTAAASRGRRPRRTRRERARGRARRPPPRSQLPPTGTAFRSRPSRAPSSACPLARPGSDPRSPACPSSSGACASDGSGGRARASENLTRGGTVVRRAS